MSLKQTLWTILNDPSDGRYRAFLWFINTLIVLSVGMLVYEVLWLEGEFIPDWMLAADTTILGIFLVEYLARLWVIRGWKPGTLKLSTKDKVRYWVLARLKFIFSPWGLIDLMALLPIFPFLRSLRILRLLRLLRSVKLFRYARPVQTLALAVRDNALMFAVAVSFVMFTIVVSAVMLFFAEYGINEHIQGLDDTLWWAIVTVSTVGFGDITPATTGGRVIGAGLMFMGMFVIALFAGVISSTLVGHLIPLRLEQVRMSSITDHVVVVGWNEDVPMLLAQMKKEHGEELPAIILMAPIPRPESLPQEYTFVQGDFTKEEEYDKVRLLFARTVIVVADLSAGAARPQARDASTVLTVFTIRSLEQKLAEQRSVGLHVVAEVLDPENIGHATAAGADEVIPSALLSYSIIAHTAGNPGVGGALSDLLLASRQNVYTSDLPVELFDSSDLEFREVRSRMHEERNVMVVGVVHQGVLNMNPPASSKVYLNDDIVYIGPENIGNGNGNGNGNGDDR
jgi:voltage-gated potassium channel